MRSIFGGKLAGKKSDFLLESIFDDEIEESGLKSISTHFSPEKLAAEISSREKLGAILREHLDIKLDTSSTLEAWASLENDIIAYENSRVRPGLVSRIFNVSRFGEFIRYFSGSYFPVRYSIVGGGVVSFGVLLLLASGHLFSGDSIEFDKALTTNDPQVLAGNIVDESGLASASDTRNNLSGHSSDYENSYSVNSRLRFESVFSRRILSANPNADSSRVGDPYHLVSNDKNNIESPEIRSYRLSGTTGRLIDVSEGFNRRNDQSRNDHSWDSQLISRERILEELSGRSGE
ncbi:MAG TPA: hypothetical protein PKA63_05845 [Oligoflexia bacterium]|nr:hypothetical protein [Oligoflexia bacterium]HMP48172.1 hypothetical protein [Oligoflexia bacterium]